MQKEVLEERERERETQSRKTGFALDTHVLGQRPFVGG